MSDHTIENVIPVAQTRCGARTQWGPALVYTVEERGVAQFGSALALGANCITL
tara:strand:+ start:1415 stop:1573 length:159 start_codon:yes stop_codon:yes gene_type:complete